MIKNVLYCYDCTLVRVTKKNSLNCTKCKKELKNIGWIEEEHPSG